ncbi:MAG TPA: SDR family NAD(P)-dependent oxidoreductase [Albitalea sp.]|jgi:3-oxoacyl-[acyl-carrier protein] reductase|nr:SDR family NAD(P)-dependent oxidoreductase [Albitalea sp.]
MQILITGAANGIGAAIAAAATAEGHRVVAADCDAQALRARWQAHPEVRCEVLDVAQASAWQALVDTLEGDGIELDVLINVAGVLRSGQAGELRTQDIDLMLDVNVRGVIYGTNAVAAAMKPRRRGHIVNIGSTLSLYPTTGTTVYAATKLAVRGFSSAAAGDLRPHGIAVTLFGPSAVKTQLLNRHRGDSAASPTSPGARALDPQEVADAILGPVLRKRPVEYFMPLGDEVMGKLGNAFPSLFMS